MGLGKVGCIGFYEKKWVKQDAKIVVVVVVAVDIEITVVVG